MALRWWASILDVAPASMPGMSMRSGREMPSIPKIHVYIDSGMSPARRAKGSVKRRVRCRYLLVIACRADREDADATSVFTMGARARATVQTASTP